MQNQLQGFSPTPTGGITRGFFVQKRRMKPWKFLGFFHQVFFFQKKIEGLKKVSLSLRKKTVKLGFFLMF